MSDDRAERLRDRRQRSSSRASEPSETDETGETEETGESVKDERTGTYMYLPDDQKQQLSYQFKRLSAEYEREFGEEFEKNRHFYPLVISHGLDSLDEWDASDVREKLDE